MGRRFSLSARDILKEPADPERKSALSQELAEGPVAAEQVKEDASTEGVSERTLKRAKRDLGVGSNKRGGVWYWDLPREKFEED